MKIFKTLWEWLQNKCTQKYLYFTFLVSIVITQQRVPKDPLVRLYKIKVFVFCTYTSFSVHFWIESSRGPVWWSGAGAPISEERQRDLGLLSLQKRLLWRQVVVVLAQEGCAVSTPESLQDPIYNLVWIQCRAHFEQETGLKEAQSSLLAWIILQFCDFRMPYLATCQFSALKMNWYFDFYTYGQHLGFFS